MRNALNREFKSQGHSFTGAWENSQTETILSVPRGIKAVGTAFSYGNIVSAGVTSGRIPFDGSTGRGGTSQYIQGLVGYFKKKGLNDKQALGAAFATAHTHKKEGMPSLGSYRYSKNGQRLRFISRAKKAIEPDLNRQMREGMDKIFNHEFKKQKSEVI